MSITRSHIAYYSDDECDDDLTEMTRGKDERLGRAGAGHGSAQSRSKSLPAPESLQLPPAGRGRGRGTARPFRPSPLALYCESAPSPVIPKSRPRARTNSRRELQETIRQLERVAQEVKLMHGHPRGRGKARAPSPPPLPPAIPPRNPMRRLARPRTPSPPRPLPPSDSDDSSSSYSSTNSSPNSSPGSSPDLSDPFHAPILKGEVPPAWLIARMSHLRLAATLAAQQPQIKLTAPSEESLARARLTSVKEQRNPRWAGLWDGEPDEIKWIEEYGQWSPPIPAEQPQDELGAASDYDSDALSVASSIFTNIPDTSSMSTSPPTSPTKARQSPVYHDFVRAEFITRPLFLTNRTPVQAYPLIPQRSPTRPLNVSHKPISKPQPEPTTSRPVLWLKRTMSKASMLSIQEADEKEEKPRRRLKKQASPTQLPSPYVRLVEGGFAYGDRPWRGDADADAQQTPMPSDVTFPPSPVPTLGNISEHSNGSAWSVDSEKPQKGWGTLLGQWFKRSRASSRVEA
ncbi:hypothetical protein EIP86_004614 [Pleurotus ostreatoroseus]|nr:hypothetical protein EIP86_004614 [Pleurotus ostreatoroseus]